MRQYPSILLAKDMGIAFLDTEKHCVVAGVPFDRCCLSSMFRFLDTGIAIEATSHGDRSWLTGDV